MSYLKQTLQTYAMWSVQVNPNLLSLYIYSSELWPHDHFVKSKTFLLKQRKIK